MRLRTVLIAVVAGAIGGIAAATYAAYRGVFDTAGSLGSLLDAGGDATEDTTDTDDGGAALEELTDEDDPLAEAPEELDLFGDDAVSGGENGEEEIEQIGAMVENLMQDPEALAQAMGMAGDLLDVEVEVEDEDDGLDFIGPNDPAPGTEKYNEMHSDDEE